MKSLTIFKAVVTLLVFLSVAACDSSKKGKDSAETAKEENDHALDNRDDEKDADFIVETVAGNYAEIKLAQLALNRSADAGVKQMATKLESDHTKILNDLKAYADKNGIALPTSETDEAKKDIDKLIEEKEVNDFDEKWCDALEDKHEKTINKFESRLDKTEDVELKNWISATLPALRAHLDMLKKHEDRLK